ncbi:hypothetical protein GY45DRAFT_1367576 [Cubamyces sp. BRFM 1775]|nr:hypothetical protein GY45DRAFT_1367576 [Cubamyces sp. BRFM 1775]
MSPILSERARRETPRLGKGASSGGVPSSNEQMLRAFSIRKAQEVVPEEIGVNVDDVLANKFIIDAETHREMLALIRSIPAMNKSTQHTTPLFVDEFLRSESPVPVMPELEILPVFPRKEHSRVAYKVESTGCPAALNSMSELSMSLIKPVAVKEEDEEDLAEAHLVVVDGWQAWRTSSPVRDSTPSLADSSSEIDELFVPSSPRTDLFNEDELFMEEYQMPRSEKIGGRIKEPSLPGKGSKLSDFLQPLIRIPEGSRPRVVRSPKSQPSSPRTSITASMLGQPPSVPDVLQPLDIENPSSDDSIIFAVKTIERACGELVKNEDPAALILGERLEEREGMLMDVPVMRPPNEHGPGGLEMPMRLPQLLAPTKVGGGGPTATETGPGPSRMDFVGCLRKAKGLQPLSIELSWVPFKYGLTVPTDEDAADVENDPCPQLTKGIDLAQDEIVKRLATLMNGSMAFGSQPVTTETAPSMEAWTYDEGGELLECSFLDFEPEKVLLLTRRDRRRLAGLSTPWTDDDLEEVASLLATEELTLDAPESEGDSRGRPTKRVRFDDYVLERPPAPSASFSESIEDMQADDSGVFLWDDSGAALGSQRQTFGQLASDAEGFDGNNTDGNVFFDMDMIHSIDFPFDRSVEGPLYSQELYRQDERIASHRPSPSPSPSDYYDPAVNLLAFEGAGSIAAASLMHQGSTHDRRASLSPIPLLAATTGLPAATSRAHVSEGPPTVGSELTSCMTRTDGSSVQGPPASSSVRQSLADFLTFCGKADLADSGVPPAMSSSPGAAVKQPNVIELEAELNDGRREMPVELINDRTVLLPNEFATPGNLHVYMASVGLIQKRAFVRALSSLCNVDLVEREQLASGSEELQLILDCDTAVFFAPVETLPTRVDALTASLTQLSWRFARLLLVLECYPSSCNYRNDRGLAAKPRASVWSPPVVKAVKKLRRDVGIADGVQTKRIATVVEYAFAHTVEEAAAFVRLYGDAAAAAAECVEAVWGDRSWLTHDERDGEYDLCGVDGMNLFAASLLLSQTSLEDFLEKSADERLLDFEELIGMQRLTQFNIEMARRLEVMQLPPSSPITGDASSSSNTIPYIGDSEIGDMLD